jgi:3',5'-cyclic AMP phosphodiesterase CpdA
MGRWMASIPAVLLLAALTGAEPGNDFRFSILGDRTGSAIPGVYERIWSEIGALHPDFAINVGDTIEGVSDQLAESQWRELRPLWNRYRFPLYFTPGNHDIWSPRSLEVYKKETGRSNFYSFNYQDAHFTVLDNSATLDLSDSQLRFLEDDLKANQSRSPKFVFFHVPFWIAFLKLGSGEFPLHQLARKYGVNYILSGHGHQFVHMTRDGINYIEVGSSGAKLKGEGFSQGWFYQHLLGVVKAGKVELSVKELDSPAGKGRMFRVEDWDRDGPKFKP